MNSKLVSIIVPVYNTSGYLCRCLDSIICQTYTKIEIVLIDDGSTDDSYSICQDYASRDERIKVYKQRNRGNNAARKRGLKESSGDYIVFVDSDDWIESDCVSRMMEVASSDSSIDAVFSNVYMENTRGEIIEKKNYLSPGVYRDISKSIQSLFYDGEPGSMDGILSYLVARLYRRQIVEEIINGINDEIQLGEDKAFTWTLLLQNRVIAVIDVFTYHYCIREKSIMTSQDTLFLVKVNYLYEYLKRITESETDYFKRQVDDYIMGYIRMGVNWKLGMTKQAMLSPKSFYQFDPGILSKYKKIMLYGAGRVGTSYYDVLGKSKLVELVAWADKKHVQKDSSREKLQVPLITPEQIMNYTFDVVLVAVLKKSIYDSIRSELLKLGILSEKICWAEPISKLSVYDE